MKVSDYFDPVALKRPQYRYLDDPEIFCSAIDIHTQNNPLTSIDRYSVVLIGVPESSDTVNAGAYEAPDGIRGKLYQLARIHTQQAIADLGNIRKGNDPNDVFFSLRDVLIELFSRNISVVLIGGSQSITYSAFLAFKFLKKQVNMVVVDAKIDTGNYDTGMTADNYLSRIMDENSTNSLFDLSCMGYQSYFTSFSQVNELNSRLFSTIRLGEIRNNISQCEPWLRDASLVSFDINTVRQSDAPANVRPSPSGICSEEACQMAKYAGMGEHAAVFGLFEINPAYDRDEQTLHLGAQMIWYYLEGLSRRVIERYNKSLLERFLVNIGPPVSRELVFYKSPLTQRWWIEVPAAIQESLLISCSYDDYCAACNDELPDRWWKIYQKVN